MVTEKTIGFFFPGCNKHSNTVNTNTNLVTSARNQSASLTVNDNADHLYF